MANGDGVSVQGPDGKTYQFPQGTDKNAAIGYFKKKGIGAAPTQGITGAPPSGASPEKAAPSASPTRAQSANQFMEQTSASIQRWRPRWDDPKTLLQDPTWYGRSSKYLGREAVGAGTAGAGLFLGELKILNDTIASIDPTELYNLPAGEP